LVGAVWYQQFSFFLSNGVKVLAVKAKSVTDFGVGIARGEVFRELC